MDKPIINSLLDTDKYKLTMCQIVHDLHPNTHVEYTFNNRTTSIPLAKYIDVDELKEHIKHIQSLRFSYDELTYLKTQPEFKPEFINFLSTMNHNLEVELDTNVFDYQIRLSFKGKWDTAILYETLFLSLINEMFGRNILKVLSSDIKKFLINDSFAKLRYKLNEIKIINNFLFHPKDSSTGVIKFIEFGTRRRHSLTHQRMVINECLKTAKDNFEGTSNYMLAKEFDIKAIGTQAHEWIMVRASLDSAGRFDIDRDTQKKSINAWLNYYGKPLSIILTDTFGTKSFLQDFDKDLSNECIGVRQDSGDPITFGYAMINHYKRYGINPKDKTIVFSDGLDVNTIIKLYKEFGDKINVAFGWGTNLTNDVGIVPLSIVIKATEANGYPTVKLSDNICKATGERSLINMYIKTFKPEQTNVETVY